MLSGQKLYSRKKHIRCSNEISADTWAAPSRQTLMAPAALDELC